MIVVYSINSSGTTWLNKLFGIVLGDGRSVAEPFSPNAWGQFKTDKGYLEVINRNADLRGRWIGRNEQLTDRHNDGLTELFDAALQKWPKMVSMKTLDFSYWEFMEQYFGEVKFIRLTRDFEGWLSCIARKGKRSKWYSDYFYYPVDEPTPWWLATEEYCTEKRIRSSERNLIRAAMFYQYAERWYDEHQPKERYDTSFELLSTNWDVEPQKIMDYCGLPQVSTSALHEWAGIVPRSWDQSSYDALQVSRIAGEVVEWLECRLPSS